MDVANIERSPSDEDAYIAAIEAIGTRHIAYLHSGIVLDREFDFLDGRPSHWASLDRLRALGNVQVIEERFVRDGDVWCSAGVSAGIDMTLAFIASLAGDEKAGEVQLAAEYYPDGVRYGGADVLAKAPAYAREA